MSGLRLWKVLMLILCAVGIAFGQAPVIKPGDTVQLIALEEGSINRDYKVTADGLILVDFLGAVKVAGLTEEQAAAKISKQLVDEKIVKVATVRVKIVNPQARMVKFTGAVKVPAETPWREGLKLSDIIRLAETLPETDLAKVQVKSESGEIQIADTTKGEDPVLKPGDEVTFFTKSAQPQDPINPPVNPPVKAGQVTAEGSVVLPGTYDISPNLTVGEFLVRCGGFTATADLQSVTLERGGAKRTLTLPADREFPLLAGDIVRVGERRRPKMFVILDGAVRNPGRYEIEEGAKLSEVIQLAGGFTQSARTNRIRIFSTGNEKPREINYDDILLGYRGDQELKPGQTIEVPGAALQEGLHIDQKTRRIAGAIALLFLFAP